MLDLKRRGPDVRRYVAALENGSSTRFRPSGFWVSAVATGVGVWVARPELDREDKNRGRRHSAQAMGQPARIAINIAPDLSHFSGIVPVASAGRVMGHEPGGPWRWMRR